MDWIEVHPGQRRARVFVSATTGQGLPALRELIARMASAAGGSEPTQDAEMNNEWPGALRTAAPTTGTP
jgi:50S ribosomal subunit-associated GTPase HflX